MIKVTAYEHGARESKPLTGPDPSDAFSQEAAENKKPRKGVGLTEPSGERSENDKSDLTDNGRDLPEADAQGQFVKKHPGGDNDGVISANPRVLSGNEDGDATFPFERKEDDER